MVPIGGIIVWGGALVDIPSNYQLCDGTNGTCDMQERFVKGAKTYEAPCTLGGLASHAHALTGVTQVVAAGTGVTVAGACDDTDTVINDPVNVLMFWIQRMS